MKQLKRNRFRDKAAFFTEHKNLFLILIGLLGLIGQIKKVWNENGSISTITWSMQMTAITIGFLYFYTIGKEDSIKRSREEFKEYIDNKRNLESLLKNIFEFQIDNNISQINSSEYSNIITNWYNLSDEKNILKHLLIKRKQNVQSFIDDIGQDDFEYLLLNKSENTNLLQVIKVDASEDAIVLLFLK